MGNEDKEDSVAADRDKPHSLHAGFAMAAWRRRSLAILGADDRTPMPSVPSNPQKYRVDVRTSEIDGRGAFAGEPIPARRKVGEIRGESISVREARRRAKGLSRIMIVEVSDRRAIDASASEDPLRFANHSCEPNAVLRIRQGRVEIYAMRDLAAGAELTLDYGETHHAGRLRCRCGASRCVGRL